MIPYGRAVIRKFEHLLKFCGVLPQRRSLQMSFQPKLKSRIIDIACTALLIMGIWFVISIVQIQRASACGGTGCWPGKKCYAGTCIADSIICGQNCSDLNIHNGKCMVERGTCEGDYIPGTYCQCTVCTLQFYCPL